MNKLLQPSGLSSPLFIHYVQLPSKKKDIQTKSKLLQTVSTFQGDIKKNFFYLHVLFASSSSLTTTRIYPCFSTLSTFWIFCVFFPYRTKIYVSIFFKIFFFSLSLNLLLYRLIHILLSTKHHYIHNWHLLLSFFFVNC